LKTTHEGDTFIVPGTESVLNPDFFLKYGMNAPQQEQHPWQGEGFVIAGDGLAQVQTFEDAERAQRNKEETTRWERQGYPIVTN
jgi:hypothetical protein